MRLYRTMGRCDKKKKTILKREEWGGRSDNQKDKAEEGGNGWKTKWN